MKTKILSMVMAIVMLASIIPAGVMTAFAEETYTVTFDFGIDGFVSDKKVEVSKSTGMVTKPDDQSFLGCKLLGWFEDKALTKEYNFKTVLTGDKTLYAKWDVSFGAFSDTFVTPSKGVIRFVTENNIATYEDFCKLAENFDEILGELMKVNTFTENGTAQVLAKEIDYATAPVYLLIYQVLFSLFCDSATYINSCKDSKMCFLRSQILFEDISKYIEALESGSPAKILMMSLEIFPDFIMGVKKCIIEDVEEKAEDNKATVDNEEITLKSITDGFAKIVDCVKAGSMEGVFDVLPYDAISNLLGKDALEKDLKAWRADSYFNTFNPTDTEFADKWESVKRVPFVLFLDAFFNSDATLVANILRQPNIYNGIATLVGDKAAMPEEPGEAYDFWSKQFESDIYDVSVILLESFIKIDFNFENAF